MHRPTFLHIRNMSNIDITYCKTQPINICLYCDLCRTLYYRRGFFCNLGTYNRAPYTLQANYSLPACLFFTQNRRMFHPCLSLFESLFFSNKPLRCSPQTSRSKSKKMRAGQEGKNHAREGLDYGGCQWVPYVLHHISPYPFCNPETIFSCYPPWVTTLLLPYKKTFKTVVFFDPFYTRFTPLDIGNSVF